MYADKYLAECLFIFYIAVMYNEHQFVLHEYKAWFASCEA